MEKVDKQMEKRVWQRVQSRKPDSESPERPRDNLKSCILTAQENAAACRDLSLQLIGKQWEPLRRMEQESLRMMHSLRGICLLRGEGVKVTPLMQPRDQPRRALEKCFRRSRRLWEEMENRSGDPECGPVFRRLARQAEEHCAVLTELLGKLD